MSDDRLMQKFLDFKKKSEAANKEVDRLQGSLETILGQLKEECGTDSLEKAEQLLAKHKLRTEKAKDIFEKALSTFEEEWEETYDD